MPSLIWFRNDLRLSDHPALAAAIEASPSGTVGVFVLDPTLDGGAGAPRRLFLRRCLEALDRSMGGCLVVRHGDPATVIPALVDEADIDSVHVTASTTPHGIARDDRVRTALGATPLVETGTPFVVDPGTLQTTTGHPYRVLTPYFRAWRVLPPPAAVDVGQPTWIPLPSDDLGPDPTTEATLPEAGEDAALDRLDHFVDTDVAGYDEDRDRPGLDVTSRLSPYLHFGCLHPRQVLDRLGTGAGPNAFRRQVAWRDFYGDVLFHRPDSAWWSMDASMADMETDHGADADERFAAWAEGRTGFPIVDAGMRQLRAEGWMHNRVRLITASFLVKDLHLDWQRGARHFLDHLVDGDLASNNHGWQWVAGTGTDAAPYFRVFNPTTQSRRFDPDGTYIRRWVPELEHASDRYIHEPHDDPAGPPLGYPPPTVDHAEEREEALRRYDATRAPTP